MRERQKQATSIHCWELEPSASLASVLDWCMTVKTANRLLLTARASVSDAGTLDEPAVDAVTRDLFAESLLDTFWASAWPGTLLHRGASRIYVVALDTDVCARVERTENRLRFWHQWHAPPLPSDLCAYREGADHPALVSMTHEGEGWFGAWLYGAEGEAPSFAQPADPPLPIDLIPSPPTFVKRRTDPR